MPTNTTSIVDRFNELTALAAVTSVVGILSDLAKEPSTKRYNRTTTQRRERWLQLAQLAEQQAGRTCDAAPRRAKANKPPRVVAPAPLTHPAHTDSAASAAS